MDEGDEKIALIKTIANLMKKFHLMFNSSSVENENIVAHLGKLSQGKLKIDDLTFFSDTNDILKVIGTPNYKQIYQSSQKRNNNSRHRNSSSKNKNNNRKRY